MKFTKMQGAGNDFLVINNIEEKLPQAQFAALARRLCTRRMSIGADGMMIVDAPQNGGDYRMYFYNADGSLGEMCGNGARCIARYGYENGLAGSAQTVETMAGLVKGYRVDKRLYKVRLNDPSIVKLKSDVQIDGKRYECAYVELGNPGIPHAVVPVKNLREYPSRELFDLGRKIRYCKAFPKGANVNFYEIIGNDAVYERTYERGVEDFTYACGTGTGSVVTVLTLKGEVSGRNVCVNMAGGKLIIDIERDEGNITDLYLTGPTNIVAKGIVEDEDLNI